ncbi:hypothetical protein FF38_01342 [Lucilia cuprina]|uniref:Uncharacterized protein n=1 Tax=Lucilia cuprina TaxID=7375 RepID=A0A0L0C2R9_LUCCU|nr:hypothetical protein FF38_01342 [Lucilia cuprina]
MGILRLATFIEFTVFTIEVVDGDTTSCVVFEGDGVLLEDDDDEPPEGGAEEPSPELQLLMLPGIVPAEPDPNFFLVEKNIKIKLTSGGNGFWRCFGIDGWEKRPLCVADDEFDDAVGGPRYDFSTEVADDVDWRPFGMCVVAGGSNEPDGGPLGGAIPLLKRFTGCPGYPPRPL